MVQTSQRALPRITASLLTTACLVAGGPVAAQGDEPSALERRIEREARLRGIRDEIARLEDEVAQLRGRERGVLGELDRLSAELHLRENEHERATLELDEVNERLERSRTGLVTLETRQDRRREYLTFRLRGLYRSGPDASLRRLLGGDEAEAWLAGMRYAAFLNSRDARVIREYHTDAARMVEERRRLEANRAELSRRGSELEQAERRLRAARAEHRRSLTAIREDQKRRETALEELRTAAEELARLADSFAARTDPQLDMKKFRGLLDWPADGEVATGFGTAIHPRFRTRVPHPGLDIDGELGDDIRSVFDGKVAFASWMRGYGLTAIVDHGGGLLSIYAHASVLLVAAGDDVRRGESLGKVGDSGSLRGAYLYFELRVDGKPVDPAPWLRRRD